MNPFRTLKTVLEMIKFEHTLFALPFAFLGMILAAEGWPSWRTVLWIVVAMVGARSAAMAFNRLADRRIDAANPRTAGRHLPAGQLRVGAVTAFTLVCCLGFVASTLLLLAAAPPNPWPVRLAAPVLIFICAYSFTKRFTALSHFWLGGSLLLAPLAAWIAVRGLSDLETPLILGLAVLFWVAGFDIIYACQDVDFDRGHGLSSTPARLGVRTSLRLAAPCHLVMIVLLVALF